MIYSPLIIKQRIKGRAQNALQKGSLDTKSIVGNDLSIALDEILDYLQSNGSGQLATASNGLSVVGTDIRFGGTKLDNDAIVYGGNKSLTFGIDVSKLSSLNSLAQIGTTFTVTDDLSSPTYSSQLQLSDSVVDLSFADVNNTRTSSLVFTSTNIILQWSNGSIASQLNMNVNGIGIQASSNYSAYLLSTNLLSNKTFQFPNANGTLLARSTGGAPTTASSQGAAGEVRTDGTYLYLCITTNTWLRAAMATW